MNVIVLLGIQGSGKGTQAKLLAQDLGFTHVNIGDLLRRHVTEGTELGEAISHIIQNGDLVDDHLVFDLIDTAVTGKCKGLIFDGFPRTLAQAEYLLQNFDVVRVYYLQLSEEDAIRRISSRMICKDCGTNFNMLSNKPLQEGICDVCGHHLIVRPDDKPQAIHKRFREFYRETYPLKDFFETKGLLIDVEANQKIDEVSHSILEDVRKYI